MARPPRPDRRRPSRGDALLRVPRFVQPDDHSCGPTCLAQVLEHWGETGVLGDLLARVRRLPDRGTLAVYLGTEALRRGYRARIYPYNTRVFDPTWFRLSPAEMVAKLRLRAERVSNEKLKAALDGYREFLSAGGEIVWKELTPALLVSLIDRGRPVLTGLNSTYLYRTARERPEDGQPDDVGGEPQGHFVVVCGYARGGESFVVRDPSVDAPFSKIGSYSVKAERLVNSILMGENTYDDALLETWPAKGARGR